MNPTKLSRRSLFAGVIASALLHVLKPLKAVELAPTEETLEAVLNPEYAKAEFECYFMCTKDAYETFNIRTPPTLSNNVVPVIFQRDKFTNPDPQPYPLRLNLDNAGNFIPITPYV